jgi:DNA adenine methylase
MKVAHYFNFATKKAIKVKMKKKTHSSIVTVVEKSINMRYQGGKFRLGEEIAKVIQTEFLDQPHYQSHTYFEPCVGMCGVMRYIKHPKRLACDIHPDVMCMWQQYQSGAWTPPVSSSIEEFKQWKQHETIHPNRALFGFGCSFGAHYFAGYVGKDPRQIHAKDPALIASLKLAKIKPLVSKVVFLNSCSYDEHKTPTNSIVYLDPPYQNTKAYPRIPKFDHTKFWKTMNEWGDAENNNVIIVSELTGPPQDIFQNGWRVIWTKPMTRATAHPKKGILDDTRKYTTEKLFCKGGLPPSPLLLESQENNSNVSSKPVLLFDIQKKQ